MSIRVEFITRARIVILTITVFCVLILYKLVSIQFINKEIWISKAERSHLKVLDIKATRGNIFSDDGSLLATSLPEYTVAFDPTVSKMTSEREAIYKEGLQELSEKLHDFFAEKAKTNSKVRYKSVSGYKIMIENARAKGKRYIRLNSSQISYADKKEMETWPIFREGRMKGGVLFEREEERLQPFKPLASRTVGYVSEDSLENVIGRKGIEYSFDKYLAGKNGAQLKAKISKNVWKPVTEDFVVKPEQGHDVETTLDVNIQDFAESALRKAVVTNKASNGCAIVMDVKTGDIKALANIDQVISREDTSYHEVYNNAVAKKYEPGSTMKLASVIALLEESSDLNLETMVETGNGEYKFFDAVMKDSKIGGHGTISFKEVFKVSSNVGIAKLVYETFYHKKSLQQKYISYLDGLHLKQAMNFQLKGEAVPYVKTPEDTLWSGISLPWMSIGYELEMSPLQMLALYNAVANDGYYVKPRLVSAISDDGQVVKTFDIEKESRRICSEKTLERVKEMLKAVVEEDHGTAHNIQSKQFSISGKTGTKKNIINGIYVKEYYATFAGFFPSENPQYSIMVAVDHPQNNKYYGSSVAAPVFREIADKIYTNDLSLHEQLASDFEIEKGVFPVIQAGNLNDLRLIGEAFNLSTWENGSEDEWVRARRDDEFNQVKWDDLGIQYEVVPNVKGLTIRDAMSLLENMGLKVAFEGRGRVVEQSLDAGSKLLVGSRIKLKLK